MLNVSMRLSPKGCVDDRTGERNFIEIKVGDNDADKSFDFQRTGFRYDICKRLRQLDVTYGQKQS